MRSKIFYIVLFVVCLPTIVFGQMTIDKKADYIFYISQKITWANQDNIKTFTIGIYNDNEIFNALKAQAPKQNFHNKPIKIVELDKNTSLSDINMIYINKLKAKVDITEFVSAIKGKNILLISENYEFHKSMINFIEHEGLLRFEINNALITSEGFKVDPLFAAKAIKSESSWLDIYLETEKKLTEEHKIVEKQTQEIEEQKRQIDEQQKRIEKQLQDINEQQKMIDDQKRELQTLQTNITEKQKVLEEKTRMLNLQKQDIMRQQEAIIKQNKILSDQKKDIAAQSDKINEQKQVLSDQLAKINMQKVIIYLGIIMILLVIIAALFIYRSYRIKKRTNKLLEQKNAEILQQKEEIEAQRDEIEDQKDKIEKQKDIALAQRDEISLQKQEITDSIRYAQRIQIAVLPPIGVLENIAPNNYFILNMPRDIVSGDYYWMVNFHEYSIVAASDCTGHGVPGAFMSMLGVSFLNEIMNKLIDENHPIPKANEILMKLREKVIRSLHQTGKEGEQKDGMDIALFVINHETNVLQFSGANNPIYIVKENTEKLFYEPSGDNELIFSKEGNGEFVEALTYENYSLFDIKGDKMPIGIHTNPDDVFTNKIIQIEPNNSIYIFSDGYADQFGGPNNKKFKYKSMKELLLTIQEKPLKEQSDILQDAFVKWKGNYFQVDDVLVIGMRVPK